MTEEQLQDAIRCLCKESGLGPSQIALVLVRLTDEFDLPAELLLGTN